MSEKKSNWDDPKVRRKALYAGAVALGVVLAGVGLIDPDQIDNTVQRVLDVGGPLLSLIGIRAFRNVDAPSKELEAARAKAREESRQEAQEQIAQIQFGVQEQVTAAVQHLPDSIRQAVEGIYTQPYGKHDMTAEAPEPERDPAGPGVYPGGQ